MSRVTEFLKVVALAIVASVAFGIAHDMVTAHVCLEYFTIGHVRLFSTNIAAVHALGWGIIATWWVGAILGVPLAVAARAGKPTALPARALIRPIAALLAVTGACSMGAMLLGFAGQAIGFIAPTTWVRDHISEGSRTAFMAVWWAHNASYAVGALGGIVLITWVWKERQVRDALALARKPGTNP